MIKGSNVSKLPLSNHSIDNDFTSSRVVSAFATSSTSHSLPRNFFGGGRDPLLLWTATPSSACWRLQPIVLKAIQIDDLRLPSLCSTEFLDSEFGDHRHLRTDPDRNGCGTNVAAWNAKFLEEAARATSRPKRHNSHSRLVVESLDTVGASRVLDDTKRQSLGDVPLQRLSNVERR